MWNKGHAGHLSKFRAKLLFCLLPCAISANESKGALSYVLVSQLTMAHKQQKATISELIVRENMFFWPTAHLFC